jgi:hypothetical protein
MEKMLNNPLKPGEIFELFNECTKTLKPMCNFISNSLFSYCMKLINRVQAGDDIVYGKVDLRRRVITEHAKLVGEWHEITAKEKQRKDLSPEIVSMRKLCAELGVHHSKSVIVRWRKFAVAYPEKAEQYINGEIPADLAIQWSQEYHATIIAEKAEKQLHKNRKEYQQKVQREKESNLPHLDVMDVKGAVLPGCYGMGKRR